MDYLSDQGVGYVEYCRSSRTAAVTADHVRAGQVWQGCIDIEAASRSLSDMLELAAVIVPGHDNVMFSPTRWL